MNDLRTRAKAFYNAFDFDQPINFGQDDLIGSDQAQPAAMYVERLHGIEESVDPVVELADQIDFSQGNGAYLFSGNRGSGKTTELMRLARAMRGAGYELFYVDISEHLTMTAPIELSGLLIAMLGALGEKARSRFGQDFGKGGFFERAWEMLRAEVGLDDMPPGTRELRAALLQSPALLAELQRRLRPRQHVLVELARQFVVETINLVRIQRNEPYRKILLLVDSLEHVRAVGGGDEEVFAAMARLFAQPDLLRMPGINVVYTVPAYLQLLSPGVGSTFAGGRVFTLPSVHIYERRPNVGEAPEPSERGLAKMLQIVERRHNWHGGFFTAGQVRRLAQNSGGDLRDFFRLLRLAVAQAARIGAQAPNSVFQDAEDALRRDMLPLANDERTWLRKIGRSHQSELGTRDRVSDFARLLHNKQVLAFRNGEDWYAPHPLLRGE